MMNSYTLEAYKKQDKPCFVVTIEHIMHTGVFFFNSMKEAKDFIEYEKEKLSIWDELHYNENGCTDDNMINIIRTVLISDDIAIGTYGRTYSKTMFPNGIT